VLAPVQQLAEEPVEELRADAIREPAGVRV
jgi:hypothetical protein